MSELRQVATTRADAATTWQVLADHADMAGWSRQVMRSQLVKVGVPAPNGVGALRRVLSLAGPVTEEVTGFDEPVRLEYRMTSGAPVVANYVGIVELAPESGGTRITWTIRFDPRPAWLGRGIQVLADLSTNRFAVDLATAADRASRNA